MRIILYENLTLQAGLKTERWATKWGDSLPVCCKSKLLKRSPDCDEKSKYEILNRLCLHPIGACWSSCYRRLIKSLKIAKYFRINGLKAIIISDRDGVPLLKLSKDNKFPELGSKQSFLATFQIANEQSSKMLLGRNKSIICMYKSTLVSCWILDRPRNALLRICFEGWFVEQFLYRF